MDIQKILEMKQDRGKLVKEIRDLMDRVETRSDKTMSAEEKEELRRMESDFDKLNDRIQTEERQLERERLAGETGKRIEENRKKNDPGNPAVKPQDTEEYRAAFRQYLMTGYVAPEVRALQADVDASGGYTFAPSEFVNQVIKAIDDLVFIRRLATVYQLTTSDSLGAPSLAADPADADWTTEIAAVTEDTTMAFGTRAMTPNLCSKLLKVSQKLLRNSAIPMESFVAQRLGYKFGLTQEKAFLTGNGTGKPLGVFVASANGIPATRDVTEGSTATTVTADSFIAVKYALKSQYRPRAQWILHRDGVKAAAKLKNTVDGTYIWQPAFAVGQPDTILGMPVNESEYAPNTFTTGLYVGLLGDFSYYWIADNLSMQIQRLVELYAGTNQVGFIGRLETDGAPVLAEAFARMKLA